MPVSRFRLELDNGVDGNFTDISGLDTTHLEIALKRPLGPDKKMWYWAKSIRDGNPDFRTKGAVELHNGAGAVIGHWTFDDSWPSRWSASALHAGTGDHVQEEITLQVGSRGRSESLAMSVAREDHVDFGGWFFALEIDGLTPGFFAGCSGLGLEFDVTTGKEGSVVEHRKPGKPRYSEVVLNRGFTTDHGLSEWFDDIYQAGDNTAYKAGCVVIYNRGQTEVARFDLGRCWPSKVSVSDLTGGRDEVIVDEITVQHESLNWT